MSVPLRTHWRFAGALGNEVPPTRLEDGDVSDLRPFIKNERLADEPKMERWKMEGRWKEDGKSLRYGSNKSRACVAEARDSLMLEAQPALSS